MGSPAFTKGLLYYFGVWIVKHYFSWTGLRGSSITSHSQLEHKLHPKIEHKH